MNFLVDEVMYLILCSKSSLEGITLSYAPDLLFSDKTLIVDKVPAVLIVGKVVLPGMYLIFAPKY